MGVSWWKEGGGWKAPNGLDGVKGFVQMLLHFSDVKAVFVNQRFDGVRKVVTKLIVPHGHLSQLSQEA